MQTRIIFYLRSAAYNASYRLAFSVRIELFAISIKNIKNTVAEMHRRICHVLHDVHLAARMPKAFLAVSYLKEGAWILMDLLIKNGTIVTATESFVADLAVKDGKIAAIGKDLDTDAKDIVDATGKLVLPGAIDAHTHMAMPFGGTVSADSYLAGTRAAA